MATASLCVNGISSVSRRRRIASCFLRITKRSQSLAVSTERIEKAARLGENIGRIGKKKELTMKEAIEVKPNTYANPQELPEEEEGKKSLKDYFEDCKDLIKSDGGPPRWFCPLECTSTSPDYPLLLFLPGIDGTGLGLIMHHHKLGKIFEIWCLHIPVNDRTPFTELVKMVETTVRSESCRSPNRPIYILGESLGACLGLAVAARNPKIDLLLILANPATSFSKSQLQHLMPLLEIIPDQFPLNLPYMLSIMKGDPLKMLMDNVLKRGSLPQTIGGLSQDLFTMSSYLHVLTDILPKETLQWKLRMLKTASASTNSCLHAVKAQTLILCSGKDQLLPSQEEGKRLQNALPKCEIRVFDESGHLLFLEDGVDLVMTIKGASFYRRGKHLDCGSDFIPPTPSEFKKIYESHKWILTATSPVMLSTLENGKVVRGLAGIPSEGPVLFVGYHMLMAIEVVPFVAQLMSERDILLRALAHPAMFNKVKDSRFPDPSMFDVIRIMGAVPVSATNFYRLLSSKSHVLLYPGGLREALHRKGEEYKLFWPEESEFVRMAARFGAKIVPFGAVGEDDVAEVVLDYNDLVKIPWQRTQIEEMTELSMKLRPDATGEVANQQVYTPWMVPKFPGRFYFFFGKPIETEGMKLEPRDKEKSQELYLHVKSEVEKCLAFLQDKRKTDPFRNLLPRLLYQASLGSTASSSQIPTFEL
ncbi:Esterase/lipase/thioesterase family protein, putative [Theobroma cacao]|uniref:Esterase/lipase/thioesterase family protein, putative n=1 Tax=Theobroma cacao TaxID=3641 RepID=A0A061EER6_THECC|nr:Esterase/lipase/thioesterase family protein, putative [Theobroma cacao]